MSGPGRLVSRLLRRARPTPRAAPSSVISYAPKVDGRPDPGEVVWGWVPYEEDASRGKDRPVLLIGRRGPQWLGLMLTSKDHDRDAADEARWGRHWMDVGVGDWDHERRPSEVRLDRLIVLEEAAIRREGAALDRAMFDAVLAAARERHRID
ncbi:type II toxin-antitoxin system PemK/MazF family toxin [Nocardioides sp.]|uniref:type II toxin-antitoxin system PemK/MazF family toxin n=1 Tax=Nocardioides sp. TaxID=35761 RepID=UPI0031FE57B6